MGINHWPEGERPRERLRAQGAGALSDAEILAIFLRTGTQGRSAVEVGRELLERFGGLWELCAASDAEIRETNGVGPDKITTIRAAIDFVRRVLTEEAQAGPVLDSSGKVADLIRLSLSDPTREDFFLILLDKNGRLLKTVTLANGTLDKSIPHTRELLKTVVNHGAAKVIMAHNHPSGDPTPSQDDEELTRKISGIFGEIDPPVKLLDHVIVGKNIFFSFRRARMLR